MEPKFQTSFIPKKSLEESMVTRHPRGRVSLLAVLATIIFMGSFAVAVGVYFYEQFLIKAISAKSVDLERARSAIQPALIEELSSLDKQLTLSKNLLDKHLALSTLFRLLETWTLSNIWYDSFSYVDRGSAGIAITLVGHAKSFGALALQSDVFAKIPFMKNAVITNPNLDAAGNVIFDFTADIDAQLLSYARTLQESTAAVQSQTP